MIRLAIAVTALTLATGAAPKNKPQPTPAVTATPKADPADVKRAFEKLQTLEGRWSAIYEGKPSEAIFDVVAAKSAVMQKSGFVAMYFLDGDALSVLAFTYDGNQPKLRTQGLREGANTLEFELVEVGNLKPGAGHITGLTMKFPDEDHVVQTFRFKDGKGALSTFDVTLTRASANTLK